MKDFIATRMTEKTWKDICMNYLDYKTPNDIKSEIPGNIYEQSYYVISRLIETGKVSCWHDMEKLLNKCDKSIVYEFTQRFKETLVQGQLNKPSVFTINLINV